MTGYTHQVNFSKRFVDGILAGKLYHDHLRFTCRADAEKFAAREGETIKAWTGDGAYILEDPIIVELE